MTPKICLDVKACYLGFKSSISRLRDCRKRKEALKLLFSPYPWHHRPPYLSPIDIKNDPSIVGARQVDYDRLRGIDLFRMRDTPLCSLYRLYELVVGRGRIYLIHLVQEVMYFFYRNGPRWSIRNIPDPKDPNPIRYAILAALVETMAEAFNWRIHLGLLRDGQHVGIRPLPSEVLDQRELVPDWAAQLPAIDKSFVLFTPEEVEELSVGRFFKKRNLVSNAAEFFFV